MSEALRLTVYHEANEMALREGIPIQESTVRVLWERLDTLGGALLAIQSEVKQYMAGHDFKGDPEQEVLVRIAAQTIHGLRNTYDAARKAQAQP